ncbi:hypothetical protein HaLaN_19378, partial [Haematococcus lacustris]
MLSPLMSPCHSYHMVDTTHVTRQNPTLASNLQVAWGRPILPRKGRPAQLFPYYYYRAGAVLSVIRSVCMQQASGTNTKSSSVWPPAQLQWAPLALPCTLE